MILLLHSQIYQSITAVPEYPNLSTLNSIFTLDLGFENAQRLGINRVTLFLNLYGLSANVNW